MMRAGVATGTQPSQFIARGIVPGTAPHDSCNFWHFSYARNLSQRSASAIVEPLIRIKSRSRFDFPQASIPSLNPETFHGHYDGPHFTNHVADCRRSDPDHAKAVESDRRDLSHSQRIDRSRGAQMVSYVAAYPA
jgi:hypothetical protein